MFSVWFIINKEESVFCSVYWEKIKSEEVTLGSGKLK